jgi:hypothetical protein
VKGADGWVHVACGFCGSIRKFTVAGRHTYVTHPHPGEWNLYLSGRGGDGGPSSTGVPGGTGAELTHTMYGVHNGEWFPIQVGSGGQTGIGLCAGQGGGPSGLVTTELPPPQAPLYRGIADIPVTRRGRGYRLRVMFLWGWSERRAYWKLTKAERALMWCFDVPPSMLTGANYLNAERERALWFERIRTLNLAIYKHEAEIPLRVGRVAGWPVSSVGYR